MYKLCVSIFAALFFLNSCRLPEKDKYPEMPNFPEHSNAKYELDTLPYHRCDYIVTSQNCYFGRFCMDSKCEERRLIVFDKKMEEIQRMKLSSKVYFDTFGTIYEFVWVGGEKKEEELYQYKYPDFLKEKVEHKELNWRGIYDPIKAEFDTINTKIRRSMIDSLYAIAMIEKMGENIECIASFRSGPVLIKNSGETYYSDIMEFDLEKFGIAECPITDEMQKGTDLELFDDAFLGIYPSGGGNHLIPGIDASMRFYFQLKIGNDSTCFKMWNSRISQVPTEGKTKVLLYDSKLYRFRLKK